MTRSINISFLGYNIFAGEPDLFLNGFNGVINALNPHSFIVARNDPLFRSALMESDILLPDGIGIVLGVRIMTGKKIKRITGSDLHEMILNKLNQSSGSCFYLGSSDKTLGRIRTRIHSEYPAVRIGTFSPPYKNDFSNDDNTAMIKAVNGFQPDILFVGMTAPKQEKWIYMNRSCLKVPVVCAVGAVFDFYAETVKRSGEFWIDHGLEWLPRLLKEPGRLWRRNFISNPLFLLFVFFEKVKHFFLKFRT